MQIGYAVVSDRKIIQPAVCTVMRTNLLVIVSLTLFFGCTAKPTGEESSPPLSASLEPRSSAAMGNKDEPQPPSRATEADQPPTQATLPTNDAAAVLGWEPNSPLPTSVHELFSEAEATAGGLVSRYPDLLDASEIAARIFWIGGKPLQAENVWNRVLESQPNYPYALHGLGQVATKKGDFQSAADYHWRAYQALPTYVDAALGASNAWIKTGELQRAIELLTSITNKYANTALAWIRLGQAHTADREYASAELAFSKALALNANDAEALCGFALTAARNGNTAVS